MNDADRIIIVFLFLAVTATMYFINHDLTNHVVNLQEQIDENRIECGWDAESDAARKKLIKEEE